MMPPLSIWAITGEEIVPRSVGMQHLAQLHKTAFGQYLKGYVLQHA